MFEPTYSAVNMPPEKHTGYAVQWFGMAAIIVLLFGWRLWHQYRSQGDRSEQS
jgi:cytochrome oxidase assembly protein ShyY1